MRTLTYTSLYPNCIMPSRGVFVENRLRHLIDYTGIETRVVAPVPWFPFSKYSGAEYRQFGDVPLNEIRHNIPIMHPRYTHIPKIGMTLQPLSMALASLPILKNILREGYDFDLIDAHYFYPDGVAASLLGKWLGKPVVITARGTDLNLIPKYRIPKRLIKYAADRANGVITVCQALKNVLTEMGIEDEKITVLRNGVDLEIFRPPDDRMELRKKLGIDGTAILSVGYLIERKGHHIIIDALKYLQDVRLFIAGDGAEKEKLQKQVIENGLQQKVTFLGNVPHDMLRQYYGAADLLVLASSREGWANVLLESMACGTPVVATNIWGTPEVVACREAGVLVERNPEAIASGINKILTQYPDRKLTRKYAEKFSWDETSEGQWKVFSYAT